VRVVYAELADGSSYGQRREARDILAARPVIVETLRQLDRATDDASFLQTLVQNLKPGEPGPSEIEHYFFEGVRHAQKQKGTSAARNLVHDELANAEKHLAAIGNHVALQEAALKRYEISGMVTLVSPESKKIRVYNDDIPGFMKPSDVEYEVDDQAALSGLKVGDAIHATMLTDDEDTWVLENVVVTVH
jgi:Cu/Ag efflux protein CusF